MSSGAERYPEYPLECVCAHRREWFQLAFARKAIELLPRRDELAYEAGARGLVLLAETELALERPLEVLRELYGDQVRIGPLTIRYHHDGAAVEEPHMGVRILCPREYFDRVRADLARRGAVIEDDELGQQVGVLRATAPLAALLGYPRKLEELTLGRARLTMWLSHYAPMPSGGGDAA